MRCSNCLRRNDPGARFCSHCGAALTPAPPPARPVRRWPRLVIAVVSGLVVGFVVFALYWYFGSELFGKIFFIDPKGATLNLTDETQLTVPPEGITDPLLLRVKTIPVAQLGRSDPRVDRQLAHAVSQLPPHSDIFGTIYRFQMIGAQPTTVIFRVSSAIGRSYMLDLYAWEGDAWHWLPARFDPVSGELTARLESLPESLALIQPEPAAPTMTAELPPDMIRSASAETVVSEILLTGFTLLPDGSIKTSSIVPDVGPDDIVFVPSLRNWRSDGTLTADAGQVLNNPVSRQRHLEAVVGLALSGRFPAIQLDYRNLNPDNRDEFSAFVTELAAALHQQERKLWVRVEEPVQISATRWETGAYDWVVIGQAADRVQVPLTLDIEALTKGQVVAQLMWAVGCVARQKLQVVVSLRVLDETARASAPSLTPATLAQFGPLQINGFNSARPGDQIAFFLAGLNNGTLVVDPVSGLLKYINPDQPDKFSWFYLQPATSLRYWLERLVRFNLSGVLLENFSPGSSDDQLWSTLQSYRSSTLSFAPDKLVWVWTVSKLDPPFPAPVVTTSSLDDPDFTWTIPQAPGIYQINVALSIDGGVSTIFVASVRLNVSQASDVTILVLPPDFTEPEAEIPPDEGLPILDPQDPNNAEPLFTGPQLAYTKWDGRFHNLYFADLTGQREQLILTRAAGPSWSPDKKQLFFIGEQGVNQQIRLNKVACELATISEGIVSIDLRSRAGDICDIQAGPWFCHRMEVDLQSAPTDVCSAKEISVYQNLDWKEGSARWTRTSPTGDAVMYDARPGRDYRLYFRAMVSTTEQYLVEIPGEQGDWSPDGQRIVYRSGRENQTGLWISNRDDTNPTRITDNGSDSFPAWSPDGETIAFSREIDGDVEIFTLNLDDGYVQRLTFAPGQDTLPVYTPAGEIIFRSARGGSWGIWKMSGTGAQAVEIIPDAGVNPDDWAYSRMDVK